MTLKDLKPGQKGIVESLNNQNPSLVSRVMALGIVPGEEEGVNAVCYLLQSRYLTGKTIALDGGRHLARAS